MVNSLTEYRERLDRYRLRQATAQEQVKVEWQQQRQQRARLKHIQEARRLIQEVVQATQQEVHQKIAGVVTRCLQAIWGDRYEFLIEFEPKRGKTEAQLLFRRRDGLLLDPLQESSGGVVDVAAFALRLVCIVMMHPKRRRLVVLDEPFKNVRGEEYQQRVREMLEQICAELQFQVIINTDLEEMRSGSIIDLERGTR